jgi:hypothetical protein
MIRVRVLAVASLLVLPRAAAADDPPAVDHQPVPCTVPGKPMSICASISDDVQVVTARVYFRKAGQDFFYFVDMGFTGLNYCATLPAPREGKIRSIEYYVQAMDNQLQPTRTSTFQLAVQPENICEFPPVEKDAKKAAAIKVFAMNKKQGKKLDDSFVETGVTYVPVQALR